MKRLWRSILVVLLVFLSFLLVGIDRPVTRGEYTVHRGETFHGGMFISSPGVVTIEEGGRVDGSVFMGSGVLNLNGEIGGGILSFSGDVNTGPNAVVQGHATVTSVPFTPNPATTFNKNLTADVAGWMGGPLGAAIVLLALVFYLVYGSAIGRLVSRRAQTEATEESDAGYRRAIAYIGGVLLLAIGGIYLLSSLGVEIDQVVFALALILPGLALFGLMLMRGRNESALAVAASALSIAGAVTLYQGLTDHWEGWAFAWALVLPMSMGLGRMIEGWWGRNDQRVTAGARLAAIGVGLFAVSWIFFELIVPAIGNSILLLVAFVLIVAGLSVLAVHYQRPGKQLTSP